MRKNISLLITSILIFTSLFINPNITYAAEPQINGQYAVLMDYETGEVLYEKNPHEKMYPASTTKGWTGYLVIKNVDDLNSKVTIDYDLGYIDGSAMYIKKGETYTVRQLLEGLLVHSSNDAAVVLANYVSGSVEEFASLMNEEAKKIGAKGTHFNNPNGLPDTNHYTTAYDMALMAREAMTNEVFRDIVNNRSVHFEPTSENPYARTFVSTNKFISGGRQIPYKGKYVDIKYDIVEGLKTGFTNAAGKCLLTSAYKDDLRLITAVFKSTGDEVYVDSRTLLDYGYENYESKTIVEENKLMGSKKIWYSKEKNLEYVTANPYKTIVKKGEEPTGYTTKSELDKIKLPIKKGQKVGTLEVYKDDKLVSNVDLVSKDDVNYIFSNMSLDIKDIINFKSIMKVLGVLVIALVAIFVGLILIKKKNNRRRKSMFSKKRR